MEIIIAFLLGAGLTAAGFITAMRWAKKKPDGKTAAAMKVIGGGGGGGPDPGPP
jgi:hypothetical protein